MVIVNLDNLNELPFAENELANFISNIVSELDTTVIDDKKHSISTEQIFHNTKCQNFENGFSIKLTIQRNESNDFDIFIDSIILYETPDEWLDAYNIIDKRKKECN